MLEFLFGKTNKFIQGRLIDRDIREDQKNVCNMTGKNKFEFTEQPIIPKIKARLVTTRESVSYSTKATKKVNNCP